MAEPILTGTLLGKLKRNVGIMAGPEFAIPLKNLRFGAGKNKTWGVNFQRNIAKNSEVAYWASLPLDLISKGSLLRESVGHGTKKPQEP